VSLRLPNFSYHTVYITSERQLHTVHGRCHMQYGLLMQRHLTENKIQQMYTHT